MYDFFELSRLCTRNFDSSFAASSNQRGKLILPCLINESCKLIHKYAQIFSVMRAAAKRFEKNQRGSLLSLN